ncbi:Multidrug resistance-associated protein 1 [Nymphon striatum]|nr:Multidrug resistance-associated protein 1 [Nymphon striatum]
MPKKPSIAICSRSSPNLTGINGSTHDKVKRAGETFVLKLYGASNFESLDKYRHIAYKRAIGRCSPSSSFQLASLPPTSAAAKKHSYRTYHTVQEWMGNTLPPIEWGWRSHDGTLAPVETDKPVAPESLLNMDQDFTWNTNNPDFTWCFQDTVLVWIPCGFLLLCLPYEFYRLCRKTDNPISWNIKNMSKLTMIVLLFALQLTETISLILNYNSTNSNLPITQREIGAIVLTFSYIVVLPIFLLHKKKGIHTSGTFFFFWLLMTVSQLIRYRSLINNLFKPDDGGPILVLGANFASAPLVFGLFFLELIPDNLPDSKVDNPLESPENFASYFSQIWFWWIFPLMLKGSKKTLLNEDVYDLNEESQAKILADELEDNLKGSSLLKALFKQFGLRFFLAAVALKLSSSAKIDWTTGEVINLVSVDAQRIYEGTQFTFLWITGTIYLVFSMYFLFTVLGLATLAGVGVFIVIIPVNISLSKLVDIIQTELLKIKDERVKMISEVLSGMKVLKLYAWELPFEELIVKLREKEVTTLKKSLMFEQAMVNIFIIAPAAVSLLTFAAFIYGTNEVLTPNIAFVSMSLFEILRIPLNELPFVIGECIKSAASFRRISNFIQCEEIGENIVNKGEASSNALTIENGVFTWEKSSEVCLSDINMNVEQGQLVAIVGSVGSGKSSLLSATLGEMYKLKGAISVQGRVAYVPQQAWIQNATVRDNITFNTPFLVKRYEKVLKKCALETDMKILTAGDQTEIGEKGINLSGGQKQRVSLARAVYNDADIYLFDDPLSAVDSHVGKYLFDNVIGPGGILKNKTRILVTHGLTYLPECDYVHMLKDGKIIESGSYSSMMESGKAFSELVAQFNIGQEKEKEVDELEEQTYIELLAEQIDPLEVTIVLPSFTFFQLVCQIRFHCKQKVIVSTNKETKKCVSKLIDNEGIEEGNISGKVYIHYIMAVGRFFFATMVFGFGMFTGLELFANQWLTIWSTKGAVQNGIVDLSFNNYYIGIYTMLIVVEGISFFIGLLAHTVGSTNATKKTHNVMLERVMRAPMSFFDTTPMGRIINRFSRDVNTMDTTLIIEIQKFTFFIWRVLGAMIIICANIPLFTIIAFIITVIYCRIMVKSIRSIRQLMRLESIYRSPIYSHVQESISGSTSIRAYEVEDLFVQRIYDRLDNNMKFYYANLVVNSWVAVVLQIIGSVMVFFTALFAALARETLNPAVVGLTVNYASSITMTLYFLVRSAGIVESNIVSVERLLEYTKLPQEADWDIAHTKPNKSWPRGGTITFADYQTRYREGLDLVLKGINVDVKSCEKVGIVGRTGAGKSSLTLALFRLIEPASGKIVIDGVDVSNIGLHNLRSKITIIPQDPVLFSGSFRMNLDPFNEYSDEEIWNALEHAHLKKFAKSLESGLEYAIAEAGQNLSVGQRQLICLARALLRHTKILVLDEATAAIDMETDDLIQQTIRKEFKDSTILTIAHRLNTIMDSDRVLVLSEGKIEEAGAPSYLLANKKSIFYGMADQDFTWNTNNPDFTWCFQDTVLVWIPCGFLLLCLPYEFYRLCRKTDNPISWNIKNMSKLTMIVLLFALQLTETISLILNYNSTNSNLPITQREIGAIVLTFSYIVVLPIFLLHKKKGIHTSGTFFFFWLLMTVSQLIRYRSLINNLFKPDDGGPILVLGANFASAPLVFGLFFLELIPDNLPDSKVDNPLESPEKFASYFSQMWFWWIFSLMLKGSAKTLENEDVYDLNEESQAKTLAEELEDNLKGLEKIMIIFYLVDSRDHSSLLKALFKQFGLRFLAATVVISLAALLSFVTPLIMKDLQLHLMNFITSDGATSLSVWIGIKALKLSSSAKIDWTTGEVINLVSVDAQRIYEGLQCSFHLAIGIIYLVLSIYFLFSLLGLATLAGVGVFIIIIPGNMGLAKLIDIIQTELLKIKDERIKMLSEVLSGMKVLKLYAWELPFEELIMKLREKEVTSLKKSLMVELAIVNAFIIAPSVVSLLTFTAFVYGTNEVLTPNIAFVSMSLFDILRMPLDELPFVVGELIKSAASFRRISNFIQCEEIGENIVNRDEASSNALTIENGVFTWEKSSDVCLSDINMNVEQGQLVAIVGPVGSGKSSLLSATLGEMYKLKGVISVQGRVAYVPQQAWIQNATVRDNITFNTPFLVKTYENVLKKCALETDMNILMAGDQTEIGEKGINLSGGQKQRVSLARAVYNDADVYLFDDPLSAVDSHVGKYIFDNVIGPGGILKNKTRILVTHGLKYLPECNYVYMMKNGRIIECGSYSGMMESGKAFSELVAQYKFGQEKQKEGEEENQQLEKETYIELSGEQSDLRYMRSESIASTRSLYRQIKKPENAIKKSPIPAARVASLTRGDFKQQTDEEYQWLDNAKRVLEDDNCIVDNENTSWAAFHASRQPPDARAICTTSLLPLFLESAHTVAMVRHSMDVVKNAVEHLNPGQTPVVTFDQPLFALAKQIQ